MKIIEIETGAKTDFREITSHLRKIVQEQGIGAGLYQVFVLHTTAGITVNEHADPSVVEDIAATLDRLIPQNGSYRHEEGNSPAHVKASLMGSSLTLLIENGGIVLGTWQGVFLCEFDGPRKRRIAVQILEAPQNG